VHRRISIQHIAQLHTNAATVNAQLARIFIQARLHRRGNITHKIGMTLQTITTDEALSSENDNSVAD